MALFIKNHDEVRLVLQKAHTVGPISPDQDICIAGDGKVHCNSRPSQPIESAWYCLLRDQV